jgi:hypothetical protein
MHGENTYPKVMRHCSLGSPIVSIWSKSVVLPSSGELQVTIPRQCHHTRLVEMNQVTQHLIDYYLSRVSLKAIVNPGPTHITKSIN